MTDPSIGTWASFGYHGNGMLSDVFHRNGVEEDHQVDPNSMGRPRAIATIGVTGGNNWNTGMYRYDGAGNITNIGDSFYTYDTVSRIKSAVIPLTESASGLWNPELALIFSDGFESGDTSAWGQQGQPTTAFQSFVYDAFGNLVEIVGTPGRTIAINPATNRLSAPGTTHDAAGNVTAWSGNVYSYGPFNETWKTNSSGDEWIHLYDANDQRVWSFGVAGTGANRNRWTLRGFDDKVLREYTFTRSPASWALDRELIHRGPGQLLAAVLPDGQQRHYHLDHLGSPRLITDASGAKVAFHSYFPYGEEATPLGQDGTRNKFTGHERDLGNAGSQADDLDYMHARYHNPLVGRFLSVDPVPPMRRAIGQPQSWNLYAYGGGNPLKYVDPTGLAIVFPRCAGPIGHKNECAELMLLKQTLVEAGAADIADKIQSDANGRVSTVSSALETSENFTVRTLATAINTDTALTVSLVTGGHETHGGAVTQPTTTGSWSTEINLGALSNLRTLMEQPATGIRMYRKVTPDEALMHEIGHLFSGALLSSRGFRVRPATSWQSNTRTDIGR